MFKEPIYFWRGDELKWPKIKDFIQQLHEKSVLMGVRKELELCCE